MTKRSSAFYVRFSMVLLGFASLFLNACKKDDPPPDDPPALDGGVYIINEGNYQWGNGSVDYLRFTDGTYSQDVFNTVNGRPLGDVVQSMTIYNGRAYIVVNNSGKIEVVDITNFASVGTIPGLTSPRYCLPVSASKAYVTDLYSNSISIVDLNSLSKTGQIPLRGSTEALLRVGDTVYVTNTRTSFLYLVNPNTDALIDSIAIGFASNSLLMDQSGKLWVLCAGDELQSINATLFVIDRVGGSVIRSFDLGSSLQIWDRVYKNASGDRIYYSCHGIWSMATDALTLPAFPLISENGHTFHGMGIDPTNGTIYVSDAIDYVQHGKVFRYTEAGTIIDSFTAGIIPSAFVFN